MELYDLATDVREKNNLAKERPELVEKAEALMKASRNDDPMWPLPAKPINNKVAAGTEEKS